MLLSHFHSVFAVRHTHTYLSTSHAGARHRKWSHLPSRLTAKCMISNWGIFKPHRSGSREDECTQLGFFRAARLPDWLHSLSLSLVLEAERSGGRGVWLPASVTTHHAPSSPQRVDGLKGPSCRACQTHPQICPCGKDSDRRKKMKSLKGREIFLNGAGVGCKGISYRFWWAIKRKSMFANCKWLLGGILGSKLLFRVSAGKATVRSCKAVLLCWVLNRTGGKTSCPQLASPNSAALLSEQHLDSNCSGIRTCRKGSIRSPICVCVCVCVCVCTALL